MLVGDLIYNDDFYINTNVAVFFSPEFFLGEISMQKFANIFISVTIYISVDKTTVSPPIIFDAFPGRAGRGYFYVYRYPFSFILKENVMKEPKDCRCT